jgi:hypothetical protein
VSTDEEFLAMARAVVPDHLKPLGKVVRHQPPTTAVTASGRHPGATDDLVAAIADEVGAKLRPAAGKDSADVEFVEHTKLGSKSTVVQIRAGKVARVLKRA